MGRLSFKRHRFPPEIISHAIWLYARFALSFGDVEEMLAERGLDISYETFLRWFLKFGSPDPTVVLKPPRSPKIARWPQVGIFHKISNFAHFCPCFPT